MSEKTLKQVSDEARAHRAAYADNRVTRDQEPYSSSIPHAETVSSNPESFTKRAMKYGIGRISVTGGNDFVVREHYKAKEAAQEPGLLANAAAHYQANEAAYHDIAVIKAAMDGIAIKVQQPVEMGQQVPVHVGKQ